MSNKSRIITIEMEENEIKVVYKKWTIYFTKSELANLFSIEKGVIKNILNNIDALDSALHIKVKPNKIIKIYPLDIALIIWYKLKNYSATRELIRINRIVKENINERYFVLSRLKEKYENMKKFLILNFL